MNAQTAFLLPLLLALGVPSAGAQTEPQTWTGEDDMLVFFQAVTRIEELFPTPLSRREIIEGAIRQQVKALDPFSDYLNPETFKAYQAASAAQYAGVGMELTETRTGSFSCVPYPDGPAAAAGLQDGDQLVAVDGTAVTNLPLMAVGPRIRGQEGTEVALTVRRAGTGDEELKVLRSKVASRSALSQPHKRAHLIRIFAFRRETPDELRALIEKQDQSLPLVLDLRGNPGGSLFAAIESAAFFLPRGKTVCSMKTRARTKTHTASEPPPFPDRPVFLLQDGRTASAAEIFIAALVQNERARSLGSRTYGKGVTQQIIPLLDGSALILTDGHLSTPDGKSYHRQGLDPSIPVPADASSPLDYLPKE